MKKAVILVSGGLDSSTVLALAKEKGYSCYALSFDYGQRHRSELEAARKVATALGAVEHKLISLNLDSIGGSALTDTAIPVPQLDASSESAIKTDAIPITYVPARNTVFLSLALGWAEVLEARHIFIGVNAVDYSGYPDCRPEYIKAYERMANLATKAAVEGRKLHIKTPLINSSKAAIIAEGTRLGLDYSMTVSCYAPDDAGYACGRCDACRLRRAGFVAAGLDDPTRYQAKNTE